MIVQSNYHLSYCTNIHPGESWNDVFLSLKEYTLPIKQTLANDQAFGIGLRLSDQASKDILEGNQLEGFKSWLSENGLYVFTMNGFPFGNFHRAKVKDMVHHPDWTTDDRLNYTLRLFDILEQLIPEKGEGSISTSPISYKYWFKSAEEKNQALKVGTMNVLKVVKHLHQIFERTGKILHLDIEPEPDGLIENTPETLDYYQNWLIPMAKKELEIDVSEEEREVLVKQYIRICYDVCHFAIEYEEPKDTFDQLKTHGIQIGKIQISAALKAILPKAVEERAAIKSSFELFNESTYLHQVIARDINGKLINYPDLPIALEHIHEEGIEEWRTHFHVPLFVEQYQNLRSTRDQIEKVLDLLVAEPVSNHLEVETYTWEVLPAALQANLRTSIERELQWVLKYMHQYA